MFRIDDATAKTSLPTPEATGTEGYFGEGNPTAGDPATNVRGSWLNMIQEELCSILAAAGILRSKTTYDQVNSSLKRMYTSPVGLARNLSMLVSAASATATLTADEIIVETALGGQTYRLANFNKSINLGTVGAGGMDTGAAPNSGYVALYAIYNPTSGASTLLAQNATSAKVPEVYSGAFMPSGYTASALASVWPTSNIGTFNIGLQKDRTIAFPPVVVLSTATQAVSPTALSIAGAVPPNATSVTGNMLVQSSVTTQITGTIAASVSGIDGATFSNAASNVFIYNPFTVLINALQTIFRTATIGSGTLINTATVVRYTF